MKGISWKVLAAACVFIAAMAYNSYRKTIIEHFGDWEDKVNFLNWYVGYTNFLKHKQAYESWIAWLYAYPGSSGIALNDVKSRFFQPNCKFRKDWYSAPPPGKAIPVLLTDRAGVNKSYKEYLDSFKEWNDFQFSAKSVADIKERFMEESCTYLTHSDPKEYSQNYSEVFR